MKTKKLSLHDFEAVTINELLEVKGGVEAIMYMPEDGHGGGCCCGGLYNVPIDGSGFINATHDQIAELGRAAESGWNSSVELAQTMWGITKRNAEWAVEQLLPVALPPVLDLDIYDQRIQELDFGPTTASYECN